MTNLTINQAGLDRILTVEAAPVVKRIADRVAASIESMAGTVDGKGVETNRYDEVGSNRARSAIVITHPTSAGRRAGNEVAEAALRIAGEA